MPKFLWLSPRLWAFLGFWLQFLPLSVFLNIAFFYGKPNNSQWLKAFEWGAAVAIVQIGICWLLYKGQPLNRLMLAVNGYLITAGFAAFTRHVVLLQTLRSWQESGLFMALLLVGLWTTWATPAGFVGVMQPGRESDIQRCSIVLLSLTIFALLASFYFRGQIIFSAIIPFVVISMAMQLFRRRLSKSL